MASIESTFTFANSEYRKCMVEGRKALFHRWYEFCNVVEASPLVGGAPAGQIRYTLGIVEFESGTIAEVPIHKIKFYDGRVNEVWGDVDQEREK